MFWQLLLPKKREKMNTLNTLKIKSVAVVTKSNAGTAHLFNSFIWSFQSTLCLPVILLLDLIKPQSCSVVSGSLQEVTWFLFLPWAFIEALLKSQWPRREFNTHNLLIWSRDGLPLRPEVLWRVLFSTVWGHFSMSDFTSLAPSLLPRKCRIQMVVSLRDPGSKLAAARAEPSPSHLHSEMARRNFSPHRCYCW